MADGGRRKRRRKRPKTGAGVRRTPYAENGEDREEKTYVADTHSRVSRHACVKFTVVTVR